MADNTLYNPLDRYNKLRLSGKKTVDRIEDEAGIYYKEMYIQDRRGKNGLDDTNEELIWRKNGMRFLPGKIYTYEYDPKYKDFLSFYDRRPIMLCIKPNFISPGTKNTLATGINLAFLPPIIRMSLLGNFWEFFNDLIDDDLKSIYKNQQNVKWEKIPTLFKFWEKKMMLNSFYRTSFNFAKRHYIVAGPDDGRMKNLRLMEYQHWADIGFLNSKKYLTGENPRAIWQQFFKNKK